MALELVIVAFPETSASTVLGMHDVLATVGPEWRVLHGEAPGAPLIRSRVVAGSRELVECLNGGVIRPHAALEEIGRADVVCVPEVVLPVDGSPRGVRPEIVAWLRTMYARGALLASVCSGSVLLAEAGLLDGEEATTHWAFADYLERHYPAVRVRRERVLCPAGPGARIVTAGGATSWHDLVLYLIARLCGATAALETAKVHLLQWHGDGQLPYAGLAAGLQHDDAIVRETQRWLAEHYAERNPVGAAAGLSGLKERTFKRRFRLATGCSPIDYVHDLRTEEAKRMLETSDRPVEEISACVGYEDPTFFRRLFKRKTGMTPHRYRRKFRPVASAAP